MHRIKLTSTIVSIALHPESLKEVRVVRHTFSNGSRALVYLDGRQLLIGPAHHIVPPHTDLGRRLLQLMREARQ